MSFTDVLTIATVYAAAIGSLGAFAGLIYAAYLWAAEKHAFREEMGFWVTIGATIGGFSGLVIGIPIGITTPHRTAP
jgi:uncharacterized membrane protein YfcA